MGVAIVLVVCALMLGTVASGPSTSNESLPSRKDSRAVTVPEAQPGEFPHHAYIAADDKYVYSGALITPNAILTVAHFLPRYSTWKVYMGFVRRSYPGEGYWITVSNSAIEHPEYVLNGSAYDIGIIFLQENAPLNRYIKPVALPSPEEEYDCFEHYSAMMSGWGEDTVVISERLRWIHLDVVESSECVRHYGLGNFTQSMLCAAKQNTQICGADMGGPLVIRSGNGYKLIGLATFPSKKPCATPGPHRFTRVTSFLDWIDSTIDDQRSEWQ